MTLIVARKIKSAVYPTKQTIIIVGDTILFVERNKEPKPIKEGVVKTNIITNKLAVSWAGNAAWADDFFKKNTWFFRSLEKEEIIKITHEYHVNSYNENNKTNNKYEVEFILSFGRSEKEQEPEIVWIRKGRKERNCDNAWIGSETAYREFNKKRIEFSQTEMSESSALLQVMEEVIDLKVDSSVGGFATEVSYFLSEDRFLFIPRFKSISSGQKMKPGLNRVAIGGAASGSYTFSFNPCIDNTRFLVIYINQGKFGWLYAVSEEGGIMKMIDSINDILPEKLSESIWAKYGIKIDVCFK